jgi:hypothetical protein
MLMTGAATASAARMAMIVATRETGARFTTAEIKSLPPGEAQLRRVGREKKERC